MALTPSPSPRTLSKWGHLAKHAIRVEIALLFVGIILIILGVGIGVREDYCDSADVYFPRVLLNVHLPLAAAVLAWIHLGVITNHSFNPVYSLCMALCMVGVTAAAIWSWVVFDLANDPYWRYETRGRVTYPTWGAGLTRDSLGGVIGILYLIQMSLAARAVHNVRKGRRNNKETVDDAVENFPYGERNVVSRSPPPTYYTGLDPTGYGTEVSSMQERPATVFSDLTTVKGDVSETVEEKGKEEDVRGFGKGYYGPQ